MFDLKMFLYSLLQAESLENLTFLELFFLLAT